MFLSTDHGHYWNFNETIEKMDFFFLVKEKMEFLTLQKADLLVWPEFRLLIIKTGDIYPSL